MIKTNIKLQVTPEQSIAVQKICFSNNLYWMDSEDILDESAEYIFVLPQSIFLTRSQEYFDIYQLEEVDADLFIRTNGTCEEFTCEHPGVDNTTGKCITCGEHIDKSEFKSTEETIVEPECQFAKYGFETPDFQCKLYDKLEDFILGAYFNTNKQKWTMCRWGFDGRNKQGSHNYALTPILVHKPWYETCKFPILVKDRDNCIFNLTAYSDAYIYNCTPLTDDEIEEFKRGF